MFLAIVSKHGLFTPGYRNNLRLNLQLACDIFNFVVAGGQAARCNGVFADIAKFRVVVTIRKFSVQDIFGFAIDKAFIFNACI